MRPLRLTLSAFGPFAGDQIIDFRHALDARLFGIYGPTGAGKTSILDGICFALFGESSGEERKGEDLRSHHAAPEIITEARLVFEVGAKRYHIVRRPRQTVRALRGGGLTERAHYAALFDVTGIDLDAVDLDTEPGIVLGERKVEVVADQLKTILGYTAAQFRQVVLLPQGKFRQLLTAKSDERSAVLRGLFDVKVYERLVEQLKAEAASVRAAVEQYRSEISGRLAGHEATDLANLEEFIVARRQAIDALTADRLIVVSTRKDAQLVVDAGTLLSAAFIERDAAIAALDAIQTRAVSIVDLGTRRDRAERARECLPLYNRAQESALLATRARTQHETSALEVAKAAGIANAASEALNASTARASERQVAQAELSSVIGYRDRFTQTEPLRAAADVAISVHAVTTKKIRDAQKVRNDAQAVADAAVMALATSTRQAQALAELQATKQRLEQDLNAARIFVGQTTAVNELSGRVEEASRNAAEAQALLSSRRADEIAAEGRMNAAQAAHLATHLQPGEACPVCGSAEHPMPATGSGEGEMLERSWRTAREAREQADVSERATVQIAARLSGEFDEAKRRLAALVAPPTSPDSIYQELQGVLAELMPLANATLVDDAQRQQMEASDRLAEAVAAWDQARDAHASAEKDVASTAAALAAALADLPETLRSIDALEAAIVAAREAAALLDAAHERATAAERTASDALKTLEARHGQLGEAHETRSKEAAEHLATFEAALRSARFDHAAFDLAKVDIDQIAAFSTQIDEHRQAQSSAAGRVDRANSAVVDRERPDLEAARRALQEAEAVVEQLSERLSAEGFALVQLEATRDAVIGLTVDLDAAQASYSVIGTLAQLTDGNNAQKLRLRDYAIAATFDEVLEAANVRFARMSGNRFTLLRKLDIGDGRGRSGLEIEVYDTHTDQRRDAYTLSGGEGFLASLSLALGLSDVVQAEAGGVKLDAIFIDEGFGHLDDETLDVALETLRDLVGRERAVGVISHVEAVKDQIPVGFDVMRQVRGSVVCERTG